MLVACEASRTCEYFKDGWKTVHVGFGFWKSQERFGTCSNSDLIKIEYFIRSIFGIFAKGRVEADSEELMCWVKRMP